MAADRRCVYCGERPVDPTWRPFCSRRCQLQDLARWVDGDYRLPGEPSSEPDPDGAPGSELPDEP
ncbi:MAG TPA: DNA gyrase inhibitor YacG [Vicinamibacterales bacterium]